MDTTKIKVGDTVETGTGATMTIKAIEVSGLHLPTQSVHVTYDYDDNGNTGTETVSLANFIDNMTGGF